MKVPAGRWVVRAFAVALVGVALASWSAALHASGTGTEIRLQPRSVTVERNDGPFDVVLGIADVDHVFVDRGVRSEGLGVFELALRFDPNVITIVDAEAGPFLGATGRSVSCFSQLTPEEPGVYHFACVTSAPPDVGPQGSGTLARVTVQPVGGGRSDIDVEGELGGPLGSTGDDIPFKVVAASVTVTGPPAPTATPGGPASPTATPGPNGDGTTPPGDGQSDTGGPSVGDLPGTGGVAPRASSDTTMLVAGALAVVGAAVLLGGTWIAVKERR